MRRFRFNGSSRSSSMTHSLSWTRTGVCLFSLFSPFVFYFVLMYFGFSFRDATPAARWSINSFSNFASFSRSPILLSGFPRPQKPSLCTPTPYHEFFASASLLLLRLEGEGLCENKRKNIGWSCEERKKVESTRTSLILAENPLVYFSGPMAR